MLGAFIGATVVGASLSCSALFSFDEDLCLGFALAAIYSGAYLRMSTWVPFLWAAAHSKFYSVRLNLSNALNSLGRHHQFIFYFGQDHLSDRDWLAGWSGPEQAVKQSIWSGSHFDQRCACSGGSWKVVLRDIVLNSQLRTDHQYSSLLPRSRVSSLGL